MKVWLRLSPGMRVVLIVAVWLGYAVSVPALNSLDTSAWGTKLIWAASLAGAAATVGVEFGLRPKFASIEQRNAFNEALRTGTLPKGVELEVWRGWVGRSALTNVARWFVYFPFLGFGWISSMFSQSAYRWPAAAGFSLLMVWWFVAFVPTSMRTRRLAAKVRRRAAKVRRLERAQPADIREQRRFEAWLRRPLAARVASVAALGFVHAFLVLLVADLDSLIYNGGRVVRLEWLALWAALMGLASAVVTFGDPRVRGTRGSVEQLVAYERHLRTGELPASIEPDMWRCWLRSNRRFSGLLALRGCFLVAVGVSLILTRQSMYHWVLASLLELLAIWYFVRWRAGRVQLARLAAEVERYDIRQSLG